MLGRCVTRNASACSLEKESRSRFIRLRLEFNCTALDVTWPAVAPLSSKILARQNSRRQEEQKLLRRRTHRCMFEQVAHHRDASEERYLVNRCSLRRHDDAADYHRAAVGDQHLGVGLLRIDCRNSLNARD